jgi:cation transport regulator
MPYNNIGDLPESVRHVLPTHAQEIYRASFNSAHEEYKDKKTRKDSSDDREKTSHKVAWAAVKKKYKKDKNGHWSSR